MSYTTRLDDAALAILGSAPPPGALDRARDAFVSHWPAEIIALGYDPQALSSNQASAFVLLKLKNFCRDVIRSELGHAAQAAVQGTVDDAAAQADTDWPQGVA